MLIKIGDQFEQKNAKTSPTAIQTTYNATKTRKLAYKFQNIKRIRTFAVQTDKEVPS